MHKKLLIVLELREPHLSNARHLQTALESKSYQVSITALEAMVETSQTWNPDFVLIDMTSLWNRYSTLQEELSRFHKDSILRKVPVYLISPFVRGSFSRSSLCFGYPALAAPISPESLHQFLEEEAGWFWRHDLRLSFCFKNTYDFAFDELVVQETFFNFSTKRPETSRLFMSPLKVVTPNEWMQIESICEEIDVWRIRSCGEQYSINDPSFGFHLRLGTRSAFGGGPVAGDWGLLKGPYASLYRYLENLIHEAPLFKFPEKRLDVDVVFSVSPLPHPLTLVLHNVTQKSLTIERILMLQKTFSDYKDSDTDQPVVLQGPQTLMADETIRMPLILTMPDGQDQSVTEAKFKEMMSKVCTMMFVLEPNERFWLGAMPIHSEDCPATR
jgi:hypothetical protein